MHGTVRETSRTTSWATCVSPFATSRLLCSLPVERLPRRPMANCVRHRSGQGSRSASHPESRLCRHCPFSVWVSGFNSSPPFVFFSLAFFLTSAFNICYLCPWAFFLHRSLLSSFLAGALRGGRSFISRFSFSYCSFRSLQF